GMRWSEINFDRRLWTIPGIRMKNGKSHDVHLSEEAVAKMRGISPIEGGGFGLSTTGKNPVSGFSQTKTTLDAAITRVRAEAAAKIERKPAAMAAWRTHDLRRSGVSMLARLGFDSIVADKLLAHQPAKLLGVAAVYQRHDFARERAAALDAWATHVTGDK